MTESKAKKATAKVGDTVDVPEGATVVFPDNTERVVTGGAVVLDTAGVFVVDGDEVHVK